MTVLSSTDNQQIGSLHIQVNWPSLQKILQVLSYNTIFAWLTTTTTTTAATTTTITPCPKWDMYYNSEGSKQRSFQCRRCSEPLAPAICCYTRRKLSCYRTQNMTVYFRTLCRLSPRPNPAARHTLSLSLSHLATFCPQRCGDVSMFPTATRTNTRRLSTLRSSDMGELGQQVREGQGEQPVCHLPSHSFTFSFRRHFSISLPPLKNRKT